MKAKTFYFSTAGNDTNPGDANNPKQTLTEAASLIGPGVIIRFRRRDVWYGNSWDLSDKSGALGGPCVLEDWGDPADPSPVISNSVQIPTDDGNWTDQGDKNWSHSLGRIDVEDYLGVFVDAVRKLDDGSSGQIVNFDEYREGNGVLTVYFDDNSPAGHLVEVTYKKIGPVLMLANTRFLTFRNITFRGGTSGTVRADAPTENLTFENVSVRQCSMHGIQFLSSGKSKHTNPRLIDCMIDRDWGLYMNVEPILKPIMETGGNGLEFRNAVEGGLVQSVRIADFGHTALRCFAPEGDAGIHNLTIEDCDISAPKDNYCRAFAFSGGAGLLTNMVFRRNRIHDVHQQSKIGGENNQFYANIFHRCYAGNPRGTKVPKNGVNGVILHAGAAFVSKNNLVVHNTFYDIEWNALWVKEGNSPDNIVIKNNLFVKTGRGANGGFALCGNAYLGDHNSFINNGIWKYKVDDDVFGITGSGYTATAFNRAFEKASGNMQVDPLFVDDNPGNPDLHLQSSSPYVSAGAPITEIPEITDFEGHCFDVENPSVGALQFRS